MQVPFVDISRQHETLEPQIQEAISQVFSKSAFVAGAFAEAFEEAFAQYCGVRHAVGVGSGTDALWLALRALGVGEGAEVITVPNSFIATAEAISLCGAQPVFVDVDPVDQLMDVERLEAAITPRAKAIVPVHLFGQTADMDPIMEVAQRYGLWVVEDSCQAHGALYKGRRAGSIGHAGCFSFYPSKNLGACGEGGAVVTNDPQIATKVRVLRDHGQSRKYTHAVIGWNARLDGLQGAILSVKLPHLEAWNEARRRHAKAYKEGLEELEGEGLLLPKERESNRHVYHLYPIRVKERDRIMEGLGARGVSCGIHYPVPIHLQEAYRSLGYAPGSFPVAEQCARELLSLPMFPELREEEVAWVIRQVRSLVG